MSKLKKILVLIPTVMLLMGVFSSYSYAESVPSWIKNTAMWFGEDMISEQEFLNAIKFLIENNIITIDKIKDKVIVDPVILTPDESFNDPRITQCNILYSSYVILEYAQFQDKHSHITYLYDCVDLYNDKVWDYQGDDKKERIYNKFIEIHEQNLTLSSRIPVEPYTEVRSTEQLYSETFMVQFDICAGDLILDKAKVLVKSDMEIILVGSDKDILPNSCRNYETKIYSTHLNHIEIEIIEKVLVEN
ncbi:plastocyanin [Candidatus Nitrosopumilus sp. SW]|uniref:plastocyanin n=1 Tax=Candidatus Nitrosopumilus sp. SW TaxID=2508726 RepID=UPI00114D7855|nr:plastocyanin [Candidatus Nitrosopumilus sp. SW]QDI88284.1 plastocyanin [Candidatus Nitrosopumilus sp. SW]